jgi:N-acetylglutamate synthase-like GNAT family acetyltransferase
MNAAQVVPIQSIGVTSAVLTLEPSARREEVAVRPAGAADARGIHSLILCHQAEGRLLARERDEIARHADRFIVAVLDGRVVGCVDLAPLGGGVAEVRSLVVHADARSLGLGRVLVDAVRRRAAAAGFHTLCAFTHAPGYFAPLGFSIVPHEWLPEKIQADCATCPEFRHCGQYAVALPLAAARAACVPLVSLHG